MFAHEGDKAQVNRVRTRLACASAALAWPPGHAGTGEGGRIYAKYWQDIGPYPHAKLAILSAFGFVDRLPVVVNADKKGGYQKVNGLAFGLPSSVSGAVITFST